MVIDECLRRSCGMTRKFNIRLTEWMSDWKNACILYMRERKWKNRVNVILSFRDVLSRCTVSNTQWDDLGQTLHTFPGPNIFNPTSPELPNSSRLKTTLSLRDQRTSIRWRLGQILFRHLSFLNVISWKSTLNIKIIFGCYSRSETPSFLDSLILAHLHC